MATVCSLVCSIRAPQDASEAVELCLGCSAAAGGVVRWQRQPRQDVMFRLQACGCVQCLLAARSNYAPHHCGLV
jgi:hypothetical protein